MFISFIIVSYNTKDRLISCLDILHSQLIGNEANYEVIVVDNASIDKTTEALEARGQFFIANETNLGFAKACNQGAKVARGDILLFLNSDVEFSKEAMIKIIEQFKSDSMLGIISPRLVADDQTAEKLCCGRFPNLSRLVTRQLALPNNSSEATLLVDWVSGAALAIRSQIFKNLNGFDENFFMYFEDVDLCYRSHTLGYKTMVLNNIKLVHYRGASLADNKLRKKYYYRSQLHYFYKNFGLLKSAILLLLRWPFVIKSL